MNFVVFVGNTFFNDDEYDFPKPALLHYLSNKGIAVRLSTTTTPPFG
jgi:hypothetical protein